MKKTLGIPTRLSHIWIGPLPPPRAWMQTWIDHHSSWEYTLYDNHFLNSFHFKTQKQIDEYLKRGMYAGVADLMRLEILYEFGGLMPGADSICLKNTDTLFLEEKLYTVYENEFVRGDLVSPIQAAPPKSSFIAEMIDRLSKINPDDLDEPWISTGNLFTAEIIKEIQPEITIFPSHYFIPVHYTGICYTGTDTVFAKQLFGTTHSSYKKDLNILDRLLLSYKEREAKHYKKRQMSKIKTQKANLFKNTYK